MDMDGKQKSNLGNDKNLNTEKNPFQGRLGRDQQATWPLAEGEPLCDPTGSSSVKD